MFPKTCIYGYLLKLHNLMSLKESIGDYFPYGRTTNKL